MQRSGPVGLVEPSSGSESSSQGCGEMTLHAIAGHRIFAPRYQVLQWPPIGYCHYPSLRPSPFYGGNYHHSDSPPQKVELFCDAVHLGP